MEIRHLPEVSVNLMHSAAADNDPFYGRIVQDFYEMTQARHRKFPLVKAFDVGVALCVLPESFDDYFMYIEASARRNYKKAVKKGCEFRRIDYNAHLSEIRDVLQSTDVRQGQLPESLLKGEVVECKDPASKTNIHDYPYYGVFKNGTLVAYAGCLVAGEVCFIEQIYGHADYLEEGVVPMLIIDITRDLYANYPAAKYCGYGSFYGAGQTMRRFKRKFKFLPHKVSWRRQH